MPAKPTRLDSRLFSGSDELVYLCLPNWFRNALLSLTERMVWSRVWLDENWRDYDLTKEDITRIEYGIWQLTRDDCGCEDQEVIDEIIARLEELETMNIYNNVNCGCGCGCEDGQPAINDGIELTDLCPPADQDETAPPQTDIASKCNLANYLVVQVRTTLINQWSRTQTFHEFNDWWINLFAFMPAIYITGQSYASYVAVSQWLSGKAVDWITSNYDPLFNEMVCALYTSTTPANAESGLLAVMDKLPYPLNQSAKAIAQRLPFKALFASDIVSPPGFSGRECCGSVPDAGDVLPLPVAPPGYFWGSLIDGEFVTVPNNNTGIVSYVVNAGRFTMQPLTTQSYHEVTVTVDISALTGRLNAASAHALYIQVVNPPVVSVNGNDGLILSNSTGGDLLHAHNQKSRIHFDNAEYAAVVEFSDLIDSFPIASNYGNGAMSDQKASFRMQSYGTSGADTIEVSIAYLLKDA